MSVADRLNKLTTDITSAYTSIENKGGSIPSDKNTDNLHTAIDSIEVIESETAEGESISLTNTKAMPYSDYVVKGKSEQEGEPSPSNPSEIHSVADDVNLFDYSKIINASGDTARGTLIESYSNGVKVQGNVSETPGTAIIANGWFRPGDHYDDRFSRISVEAGTDIYISADVTLLNQYSNSSNKMRIYFYGTSNYNTDVEHELILNQKVRISQKYTINEAGTYYPVFTLNSNTLIIENIKISTSSNIEYSPYNQGTVTIKQRGTTESNDYTIQTEPLRSLPNGVKDTIEADGIHRRIRVLNLPIADMNNNEDYPGWTNVDQIRLDYPNQSGNLGSLCKYISNIAPSNSAVSFNTLYNNKIIFLPKTFFNLTQSQWKEQYSDLVVQIQYELAEEIIEPLTQNQANTMLDIIKTGSYEGTTNIYTDEDVKPTMKVGYYKKS